MKQCWERNKSVMDGDVVRGGYTKNEIENYTGCIPLLLDNLAVDENKMGNEFFLEVYLQAMCFEQDMKLKCSPDEWTMYAILCFIPTT